MSPEPPATSPAKASPRARLALALAAGIVLAAIVVIVAIGSGGDSEDAVAAAPARCVEAWNADEAALAYGRHNFNFHRYTGALVAFLSADGAQLVREAGGDGLCAVVFPSESLDTEPAAAGQVLDKGIWLPISEIEGIELTRVAELQALAAGSPNTTLSTGGSLTPS